MRMRQRTRKKWTGVVVVVVEEEGYLRVWDGRRMRSKSRRVLYDCLHTRPRHDNVQTMWAIAIKYTTLHNSTLHPPSTLNPNQTGN